MIHSPGFLYPNGASPSGGNGFKGTTKVDAGDIYSFATIYNDEIELYNGSGAGGGDAFFAEGLDDWRRLETDAADL